MSDTFDIPEHWEILNFPATLEIWDKKIGKTIHAVYKGGLVVEGPSSLPPRGDEETATELRSRLIREALAKEACV